MSDLRNMNAFNRGMEMTRRHRIWELAERADWNGWRPRGFWRWLLRRCDQRAGLTLDYEDKKP